MTTSKKKTRILIALPNLGCGGAEKFLVSLADALEGDYEIHFAVASKRIEVLPEHVNIKVHSFKGIARFMLGFLRMCWVLRPDFVLSSILDLNLIVLMLSKITPLRTKFIVREALDMGDAQKLGRYPRAFGWFARKLYPMACRIVVLSHDLEQRLLEKIPRADAKRILVIPNGVPDSKLTAFPLPEPDPHLVVAMGRLAYQKGFCELVRAFTEFRKEHPAYRLKILGEGPEREKLAQLIGELSQQEYISLPGNCSNPTPILSRASFYVLSSRFEGLSNATLEALTNGVPVLATRERTSTTSLIDSKSGILVEKCSSSDLLHGLREIHGRITYYDRTAIATRAREQFSIKTAADRYRLMFHEEMHKAPEVRSK